MEKLTLTYKEYWGYYWRVIQRHSIPGIFAWDQKLVDLIEKVCELKPGSAILDLGCGGGDQLKLFALKGYLVIGVDYVPALIDHARTTFKKGGLDGEFVLDDMRNIRYENRFDLVTMLSGTFGYFNDAGNKELLAKILRALKPGGAAFLDYLACERYAAAGHQRKWYPIDGGYALSEEWFDVPTSTYRSRHMQIMLDGRILEGTNEKDGGANEVLRCYTAKEMENLAESAGFGVAAHLTRNHIENPDYRAREDEPRGMIVISKSAGTEEKKKT